MVPEALLDSVIPRYDGVRVLVASTEDARECMASTERPMQVAGSAARSAGSLLNDFKTFVLRGNVVDLAVGIVIGAAFTSVVTAFVNDIISPLIGLFGFRNGDLANLTAGAFKWGAFINSVISFLIVAAVVFFFVVKPVNYLMSRRKAGPPPDPTNRDCPFCLSEIPIKATRCAYCTSEVPALVPAEASVTA